MKKLFFAAAALMAFGMARAQTDPKQVPQQPQNPAQTVPDKAAGDANMQSDPTGQAAPADATQPRKDELKTRDHVKSNPSPAILKDTINQKKKPAATRKAKKRRG